MGTPKALLRFDDEPLIAHVDSGYWAMQVKGLELPGYDPRSLKTMALGLAVSPRGACHNRSGAYEADFSGAVDRFHGDAGRGALVAASEDFAAVLDSLIVCKFLRKCFTDFYAEAAEMLAGVTGLDYTGPELRRAGERIHTLKKLFNIRERWQPEDDWLPERLLSEALPTRGRHRRGPLSPRAPRHGVRVLRSAPVGRTRVRARVEGHRARNRRRRERRTSMPSDETRRLLRAFGVAVTAYEDVVHDMSPAEEIRQAERDVRARLEEVTALIQRLGEAATPS
jgi:hypothetical protein